MICLLPSNKRHLEACFKLLKELEYREVLILYDVVLADSRTRTNRLLSSDLGRKYLNFYKFFARTIPGLKAAYKVIKYRPTHLIIFNDFLFCEKVVLWFSRGLGIDALLIQDGFFPITNSAKYLGRGLHSTPFGFTRKSNAIVFSQVALEYLQKFQSTERIVVTIDDFWDSRFRYNSNSKNILFLASDFFTGSRNPIAGKFQNSLFNQLSELLKTSELEFKMRFVPHPNEGIYEGDCEGVIAIGFNTYAIEELVGLMPVYRLDFGFETSIFIEEIREQTSVPILKSVEQLLEILKHFDATSHANVSKRCSNELIIEIENSINT